MHDAWTRKCMHAFSVHTLPYFVMLYIPLLLHSHFALLNITCTYLHNRHTCMHAYIQADIHTNTCRMMCVCVPVYTEDWMVGALAKNSVGQRSPIWTKIPFQFQSHMGFLFSIDGLRKHRNTRKWSLLHNPFAFVRILAFDRFSSRTIVLKWLSFLNFLNMSECSSISLENKAPA